MRSPDNSLAAPADLEKTRERYIWRLAVLTTLIRVDEDLPERMPAWIRASFEGEIAWLSTYIMETNSNE